MHIEDFFSNYHNHPILFLGTGISLRYLQQSYTWDGLLMKISKELYGNEEKYYDIKASCEENGFFRYDSIATIIERDFNEIVQQDRHGKFEKINEIFYENMKLHINLSRFKIYISELLSEVETKPEMASEISELKKIRKNIGSIVTTNYDKFIEKTFEFLPLIGNNILLSNPYGSVYKIHGCVSEPSKTIINENDYAIFNKKFELIRAQLLSLFIHNPIIFIGYNIGDSNIRNILKTIYTYVEPNTELAEKIRKNFLLIEYEKDSQNLDIVEHDIEIEGISTIRINKLKTDDFTSVYKSLANLNLPVSAMDIRKVQTVVKEIYSGGSIKVSIVEEIDDLKNNDRILVIGSSKTIQYQYQTQKETIENYFKIIEESNSNLLLLIDKYNIQTAQYFPIYGFSLINPEIADLEKLKSQQIVKLKSCKSGIKDNCKTLHSTVKEVLDDESVAQTNKDLAILHLIFNNKLELDDIENYLKYQIDKKQPNFRKLLCAFDIKKYAPEISFD